MSYILLHYISLLISAVVLYGYVGVDKLHRKKSGNSFYRYSNFGLMLLWFPEGYCP